MTENKYTYLKS